MRIEDIPGWYDDAFRDFYARFAADCPDHPLIVEVGVWQGRSVIDLALKLKDKHATICAIDCFDGRGGTPEMKADVAAAGGYLLPRFRENCAAFDVVVHAMPFESVQAASYCQDGAFDLVFIDASHDAANVEADVRAWWPKVKPGGLLAGHDANYPDVARGLAAAGLVGYTVDRTVWSLRKEPS